MKYGKLEIRAKTPGGRGLWPAIWMMPKDSIYGEHPRSGEIDIYEGQGQYSTKMFSTVHFGASLESVGSGASDVNDAVFMEDFRIGPLFSVF